MDSVTELHRTHQLRAEKVSIPAGHPFHMLPLWAGAAGGLALIASAIVGWSAPEQWSYSYLVGFLFYLSLSLGALFFVLVQFASRAGWSVVVRRLAENMSALLPFFALLFIPIALALHHLYPWTHTEHVVHDELLKGKQAFLNVPFFLARSAVYLLAWGAIGWWFRARSVQQDLSGEKKITARMQTVSGPALVVFALSITYAAFDWIMTLEPHWFSTIFGVYFFSGSVLGSLALLIVFAAALRRAGLAPKVITAEHYHDLGKLLFAFVAFWAYIAFSQYFLIWYANIPEETFWYLNRWDGSWKGVSFFLAIGHFVIPLFFFLPRTVKRHTAAIVAGSAWVLLMHYLDLYWLIMPSLHRESVHYSLVDVLVMVGLGGLFVAGFSWLCRRSPLIPVRDPRLPESLAFENV